MACSLRALHLRLFGERGRSAVAGLDIGRLDAYIVEHLAWRITVIELAQVACLSPSHFHAQFKDSVGLTPHQYLLKTRLDHAARLLRESPPPLVRIAEECGFSSQSALTTAMRRYLGLTPSACAACSRGHFPLLMGEGPGGMRVFRPLAASLAPGAAQSPVATGRAGSVIHSLQEPAYSGASG